MNISEKSEIEHCQNFNKIENNFKSFIHIIYLISIFNIII